MGGVTNWDNASARDFTVIKFLAQKQKLSLYICFVYEIMKKTTQKQNTLAKLQRCFVPNLRKKVQDLF